MIEIICIGKIKDKHLLALINDYTNKIRGFDKKFKIIECNAYTIKDEDDPTSIDKAKHEETIRLIEATDPSSYVVALDLHGHSYKSEMVKSWIETANMRYQGKLVFWIAGSYGYSEAMIQCANARWKLSDATFLHTMVRLLVVEQVYRGLMMINHRKYHK